MPVKKKIKNKGKKIHRQQDEEDSLEKPFISTSFATMVKQLFKFLQNYIFFFIVGKLF